MRAATRQALERINRRFYASVDADHFSATRRRPWLGWQRIADAVPGHRVLDLGCGNGRLAAFLLDRFGAELRYLGLDSSERLITAARGRLDADRGLEVDVAGGAVPEPQPRVQFELRDFLRTPLPSGPWDLIALFGVLHHVASGEARERLLRRAAAGLAPGGLLAMSFWRLDRSERFARRRVGWEDRGIDISDLEPGDHLLRWGHGDAVRYCHFADDSEIAQLAVLSGLQPVLDFTSDGEDGNMNRYLGLQASR